MNFTLPKAWQYPGDVCFGIDELQPTRPHGEVQHTDLPTGLGVAHVALVFGANCLFGGLDAALHRSDSMKCLFNMTVFLTLIAISVAHPCLAQTVSAGSDEACESLMKHDFSAIEDAPTRLVSAQLVPAKGDSPSYCQIRGYVWPAVGFELRLPDKNWNGNFIEVGTGGFGGTTAWTFWCPVARGYACIASDMGHEGGPSGSDDNALWAYQNLQAQIDFGYRGAHVAALGGKAITKYFYGRPPRYSYFHGCSSGGQQALSEAQRFPWDFDGIVAGAPSTTFSAPMMYFLWSAKLLNEAIVSRTDLELLHKRAVQRCDLDDGVKDGVIGDPLHCPFRPAELLCRPEQKAECLGAAKVEAIRKIYAGPTTSDGWALNTGGPAIGSELNWILEQPSTSPLYGVSHLAPWAIEYFRYVGFMPAPGVKWQASDFSFDRDYKRLQMSESIFGAANNPDLRKFKAAGGKMILYQGTADEADIVTDAIDYYETAERTMGGREPTQSFFRLFVMPGMNHCAGGEGAYAVDYLTAMEDWVQNGKAPDRLIGAHVRSDFLHSHEGLPFLLKFPLDASIPLEFTRPHYPYPVRARYSGRGDPTSADSFAPVIPAERK